MHCVCVGCAYRCLNLPIFHFTKFIVIIRRTDAHKSYGRMNTRRLTFKYRFAASCRGFFDIITNRQFRCRIAFRTYFKRTTTQNVFKHARLPSQYNGIARFKTTVFNTFYRIANSIFYNLQYLSIFNRVSVATYSRLHIHTVNADICFVHQVNRASQTRI